MPSFAIEGSVAFVTGANKANGIGRSIVEALLSAGASKIYATARYASELDDLVALHGEKTIQAVSLDVTNLDELDAVSTLYPDVTLVVNNSSYAGFTSSIQDVKKSLVEIMVNYIAPLAIGKSFARVFAKLNDIGDDSAVGCSSSSDALKPSALVNINSITSFVNFPISATYSASKAASHSLTQAQRRDLPHTLVIGVYPGPIDSDLFARDPHDKMVPDTVAKAIVAALLNGTEDVFPDFMAQAIHDEWKVDAKRLEEHMAT